MLHLVYQLRKSHRCEESDKKRTGNVRHCFIGYQDIDSYIKGGVMLQFNPVVDHAWKYTDYHIYDNYGDYLGRIIQYEWTGEWLYQTPLNKSVVMTFEEVASIKDFINRLMSDREAI